MLSIVSLPFRLCFFVVDNLLDLLTMIHNSPPDVGCFRDDYKTGTRTLPIRLGSLKYTIDDCIQGCARQDHLLAGLQNSGEVCHAFLLACSPSNRRHLCSYKVALAFCNFSVGVGQTRVHDSQKTTVT